MNAHIEHNRSVVNWNFLWSLFRPVPHNEETEPMSDGEFFGSLTLIVAALIALRIFFA
jgi:hypothetical protein